MAGMVKHVPPATIPDVVPIARTLMFSSSELRPYPLFSRKPESPTARMEMGMAVSIPCPILRASRVAAMAKKMFMTMPKTIDRAVISGTITSGGTIGTYVSPSFSSR